MPRRESGAAAEPAAPGFPIVGIGASAGGLDACRKLVEAMPPAAGMALILVQHLDPTHQSMMVDLLTGHTGLTVRQAEDGMLVEPEHLYVIPPGAYLAVDLGILRVSEPQARHGARLPFDFLLHSLAKDAGARAICVILSGTGADGSLGLKAVKDGGGFVVAQDPEEAGFDGMPRSAIATGDVDLVLPVAKIPAALVEHARQTGPGQDGPGDWLPEVINLLRAKTTHDFTLYKPGTLRRRIERRRVMMAGEPNDMAHYLDVLRSDDAELERLAKDLLINVTSFFRDPQVFGLLADKIMPDLIQGRAPDQPLRIWVAGCSTGEETYSLAILVREAEAKAGRDIKLQVFASDLDAEAVAAARDGYYPETIEADVSPERLARFFTKEEHGYRVSPELRAAVVFTVQDVLSDPPFSRLDLISCRNLLIYLQPEAQARVISLFNFALRQGGVLLLGPAEMADNIDGRFEVISKPERLFRRIGRPRPGEFAAAFGGADGPRAPGRPPPGPAPSRQIALAELCRRLVISAYAPAAVLINRRHECLYSLGPTDRYLKVAPGAPTQDLLALAREGVRTKLRAAIQQAVRENARVIVAGGRTVGEGPSRAFSIGVQPVQSEGEDLLLVCFIDEQTVRSRHDRPASPEEAPRIAELEQELAATRAELQDAIRNLETSNDEQKAINEEALSVNEEYQSTNEELLTSKEELQSLNEELTALNSQLQETLEQQRTTADDLQNVLYSTDVATLFLDRKLNIRFYTPAIRSLFNVIPSDVGRPLADLSSLTADAALLDDARTVLQSHTPIEREIEAAGGVWFVRRILPYRTQDSGVAGVVITFADVTQRRRVAEELKAAKRGADLANAAKSRFLAAASHDLRQPLQTLALVRAVLTTKIKEGKTQEALNMVARLDETADAMSGMLNALLDINQIDAGTVEADVVSFPVDDLLTRLGDEFAYHAQAKSLEFRVVPCSVVIRSDPRLLEQMIRNLLSNALKYTRRGKVLLGCRRRGGALRIEIWDTGIGIPAKDLQSIFEEYHQLDNAAGERERGLGLGLSIVKRLADLLGHRVTVQSLPGSGSVFAIDVAAQPREMDVRRRARSTGPVEAINRERATGSILVVEDDPELREFLAIFLRGEGLQTATAPDGLAAQDLATHGALQPDLILADYNLPNGLDGLQVAARLRERLRRQIPVIILTGDISTRALREIASADCVRLTKPVKSGELAEAIRRLLPTSRPAASTARPDQGAVTVGADKPIVFVVDDDSHVRDGISDVLKSDDVMVRGYSDCEAFLDAYRPGQKACVLIDAYLPGMNGLELLERLHQSGHPLPAIMMTGRSEVPIAIQAMKAGAVDFLEKPISSSELRASVQRALEQAADEGKQFAWREAAAQLIGGLTPREHEIMELVLAGHPSKNIAADLGISQRTIENHRAAIMRKTGVKSLPALARLALAAGPIPEATA